MSGLPDISLEEIAAIIKDRDELRERLREAEAQNLALRVQRNGELAECHADLELAESVLKATAEHFADAVAGYSAAVALGGERVNTEDVLAVTRAGKERLDAYFRKEKPCSHVLCPQHAMADDLAAALSDALAYLNSMSATRRKQQQSRTRRIERMLVKYEAAKKGPR